MIFWYCQYFFISFCRWGNIWNKWTDYSTTFDYWENGNSTKSSWYYFIRSEKSFRRITSAYTCAAHHLATTTTPQWRTRCSEEEELCNTREWRCWEDIDNQRTGWFFFFSSLTERRVLWHTAWQSCTEQQRQTINWPKRRGKKTTTSRIIFRGFNVMTRDF